MQLTVHSANVFHGDLAMAPDGRDHEIELLSPEAAESWAEILAVHDETKNAFVHIQDH